MPDLSEPGVWPAQEIAIGDVIEIPVFHLTATVTARHPYAGGVTLDWETDEHSLGVSAYSPDAPVRLLEAGAAA